MRCSVIIPFKNRLISLYQAISSVAAQTTACHELILVNDGGEKPDINEINRFYGGVVQYVELPYSHGAAVARNKGAQQATGDVLCFLDSDDKWCKEHVETGLEILSAHPEVDFLATSYGEATSSRKLHDGYGLFIVDNVAEFQFGNGGGFRTSGFILRKKSFWAVGGFDEHQEKHQDWDLAMRAWESGLTIGFNRQSLIVINSDAEERMSYKPNPEASLRFYKNHKAFMDSGQRRAFRKGVLKTMLKSYRLSGWLTIAKIFLK